MNDDITFCKSKCNKKKCFSHPSNIREPQYPHSVAYLKGSASCPMSDEIFDKTSTKKEYDDPNNVRPINPVGAWIGKYHIITVNSQTGFATYDALIKEDGA